MQKTLDLSIKKYELGALCGGYTTQKTNRKYEAYMDNQKWADFKDDMRRNYKDAYEEYGAGSGGEMKEDGSFPPKMASYGSSSRMIYNLSKKTPKFHFEYKLPTVIGGVANLDGFIKKDDRYIFVEAKCREPYGVKNNLIESIYKPLYVYINDSELCNLNIHIEDVDSKIKVVFSVGERVISSFDIKQMICHLLGIAVKFLREPRDKRVSFLYLCYNPKLIEIIDEKKKAKIVLLYDKMCAECNSIDFKNLFATIVKYLLERTKVGKATEEEIFSLISNFDFVLCDQSSYKSFIN